MPRHAAKPVWQQALGVVLCLLFAFSAAPHLMGQATSAEATGEVPIENMRTSQLEQITAELTRDGKFAEAIPYLAEMARRFQGTEDESLREKLEYIYFFLAAGSLDSDQPQQAIDALNLYIENFPEKARVREAREMLGDAYAAAGQVDQALQTYQEVLERFNPPMEEQAVLVAKQAEVLVEQNKPEETIPILRQVIENVGGGNTALAARAVILLVEVYLDLGQFQEISELVPILQDPVRGLGADLRLQQVLLSKGDEFREENRQLDALFCYLLIQPLARTREYLNERLAEMQGTRSRAVASGSADAILRANEQIRILQRQQQNLQQLANFGEALQVRKAQSYAALGRRTEAMWAFREIFEQFPESELAPQAAFGAMLMAAELGRRDTAADWGEQYLTSFPDHENWPEVATETAKLHAGQGNMPRAVELALAVIDRAGATQAANLAEARYVAGYGLLSRGEPDQAREHLAAIKENHADRTDVREESDYWLGMTHLLSLNPDIAQALEVFQQYVKEFPQGPNVQDAWYRVGACLFALNRLEEARGILETLLEQGLTPDQREDVLLMLGDIEYAANNAAQAEAYYRELYNTSEVAERRSHAAFRLGNILESQDEWASALEFYQAYLDEGGVEPIRAQWRMANCLQELERPEEMRNILREAILEQGNDPNQIIVGLMVRDLLEQDREQALSWIQQQYQQAQSADQTVLAQRLQVVLAREDVGDVSLPEAIDAGNAAPEVVLAKVQSTETEPARADELTDVLEQRLLDEPPEIGNTWLLPAWYAEAQRARDAGDMDEALQILNRVVSMGPTSKIAGEAMRDMGDILLEQERYQEARAAYQTILSVREWKGELWAEALYKIGMVYVAEDQPQEAFAFFQRTYVLYSAHRDWAARAYLRSGQALEAMGLNSQAAQTYEEFLEQDQFKGMTQYLEAERRLKEL